MKKEGCLKLFFAREGKKPIPLALKEEDKNTVCPKSLDPFYK